MVGGRSSLRPPSFVQKEEGLREEHGSARQIARGPLCGAARRFRRNARDQEGVPGGISISPQNRFCGVPGPLDRLWSPAFADSHRPLPPLCKGRWRTNVSRRGCRLGAGEVVLHPSARSYTPPTTPQSGPAALPAPLTQGSQAPRGTKASKKKGLSALFFYLAESVGFEPTVLAHAGLVPHKSCAFAGAPIDLTASVAAHSGSLRHDAGTGRRFLKTGAKKGLSALFFIWRRVWDSNPRCLRTPVWFPTKAALLRGPRLI